VSLPAGRQQLMRLYLSAVTLLCVCSSPHSSKFEQDCAFGSRLSPAATAQRNPMVLVPRPSLSSSSISSSNFATSSCQLPASYNLNKSDAETRQCRPIIQSPSGLRVAAHEHPQRAPTRNVQGVRFIVGISSEDFVGTKNILSNVYMIW
jgi:hypothetical protein